MQMKHLINLLINYLQLQLLIQQQQQQQIQHHLLI
jgi:hypothetical protein